MRLFSVNVKRGDVLFSVSMLVAFAMFFVGEREDGDPRAIPSAESGDRALRNAVPSPGKRRIWSQVGDSLSRRRIATHERPTGQSGKREARGFRHHAVSKAERNLIF